MVNYNKSLSKYDYGDLISVNKFRSTCECNGFIDYDGFGHPVKNDMVDDSIWIKPSELNSIPEDATHILWFNR